LEGELDRKRGRIEEIERENKELRGKLGRTERKRETI